MQIGWRRFNDKKFDLVQPWNRRILNVIYPVGFFVLLIIGSVAQMLTCFGRGDVSELIRNYMEYVITNIIGL